MSYCRWSSDDFLCDVYVYENVSGCWTTHVALNRRHYLAPLPPPIDPTVDLDGAYTRSVEVARLPYSTDSIGLPHDGETFNDPSPWACAQRLRYLKNLGYNVPQSAIIELESEGEDEFLTFAKEILNGTTTTPTNRS